MRASAWRNKADEESKEWKDENSDRDLGYNNQSGSGLEEDISM
jgi:hypothetical protein